MREGFGIIFLLDDITIMALFEVNEVAFQNAYYLGDRIYLRWASFVKSFTLARAEKCVVFKRRQKGARKDVKRAFGIVHERWGFIQQPARAYTVNILRQIMYTCIILHYMILKDKKFMISEMNDNYISSQPNLQQPGTRGVKCNERKTKNSVIDKDTQVFNEMLSSMFDNNNNNNNKKK
nr:hypothetical protein [Tanacetum cinerariifolium]